MSQILIVDDQPIIRHLLCLTLGKEYQVLEAENGLRLQAAFVTALLAALAGALSRQLI